MRPKPSTLFPHSGRNKHYKHSTGWVKMTPLPTTNPATPQPATNTSRLQRTTLARFRNKRNAHLERWVHEVRHRNKRLLYALYRQLSRRSHDNQLRRMTNSVCSCFGGKPVLNETCCMPWVRGQGEVTHVYQACDFAFETLGYCDRSRRSSAKYRRRVLRVVHENTNPKQTHDNTPGT